MMNVRIKFKKVYESIFISHLDLVRTFQRAMRRAKLPMVYSEGFNPHPRMSFAQALGLGMSSIGEYMDVTINEDLDLEEIKTPLNNNLPMGIELIDIRRLNDNAKTAMSIVSHSQYSINMVLDVMDDMKKKFNDFINQPNIFAKKMQFKKNKVTIVDIKPLIREIHIDVGEIENELLISCVVACGSDANLKPELLIKALEEYTNTKVLKQSIKRIELYVENKSILIPLIDVDNI